jgi:hypothetical protein
LSGVAVGVYRDCIVLTAASYLLESGRGEQLDGDVVIPRDNLAFLQLPQGGGL